jgi:hypothetical protein
MPIFGRSLFILTLLVLGGCGGAVKGCVIAAEHIRPPRVHIEPSVREVHVPRSELPKENISVGKDSQFKSDQEHSTSHSLPEKILEEVPRKIGEEGLKEAAKDSNSESRKNNDERR